MFRGYQVRVRGKSTMSRIRDRIHSDLRDIPADLNLQVNAPMDSKMVRVHLCDDLYRSVEVHFAKNNRNIKY